MNNYFETLADVVTEIRRRIDVAKAITVNPVNITEPVNYGCTLTEDFELLTFNGRPTRKWAHVSIYRLDSGRYELTAYIL